MHIASAGSSQVGNSAGGLGPVGTFVDMAPRTASSACSMPRLCLVCVSFTLMTFEGFSSFTSCVTF